jgi:hypothetical protein
MKHIATSMGVGMLVGAGLVYFVMRSQSPDAKPANAPRRVVAEQKWCDPYHVIPFISADQCGGISSCDRAIGQPLRIGPLGETLNWRTLCHRFNQQDVVR